jgi:hypothetical protein
MPGKAVYEPDTGGIVSSAVACYLEMFLLQLYQIFRPRIIWSNDLESHRFGIFISVDSSISYFKA